MANFKFLTLEKNYLMFAPACLEAEKVLHTAPAMCAVGCRKALELATKWVYAADKTMIRPDNRTYSDDKLQALIHESSFRRKVPGETWKKLYYIVKLGNLGVHTEKNITEDEAMDSLSFLFEFIVWIDYSYGKNYQQRKFDPALVPTEKVIVDIKKIKEQECLIVQQQEEIEKYLREIEANRDEIARLKQENQKKRVFEPVDISEWETRKRYIDVDLKLLGWDEQYVNKEFPVCDMEGNAGQEGFVDYVLFGRDGLPLALIEAKRTSKDPNNGKQQAKLYADCLERKFKRRPMIFTTNGFETDFWDDLISPPRPVFSVFSQNDLTKLMTRRSTLGKLDEIAIKDEITNRYYQKEAIRAVCEHISNGFRKALMVMATGTGKTRTAISLVDVLTRGNYVTNVLFLADRTALVQQAKEAFRNFLPNMSLCNLLSDRDNKNARIVFSTYPTMLNAIDSAKADDGNILFTPAHFDLVITDEAHRSIFKKYRTIFDYFDAITVGLTATPRTEVDRNTYDFFEVEPNVPTYAYDYETAVEKDKVLVPYHNIEVKTKFLEQGIVYDELSDEDKERYEEDFADEEGNIPDGISPDELNKFIFNKDTVDMVLQDLMTNGIKVRGGQVLGKTIIFAQNTKHAQFIVDRFNALYPSLKGSFAKRIVCEDAYVQTTIREFKDTESNMNIAVSVDMMDTGIDVPEIVNLVFFKKVRSKVKFWQMIGRGTRLCEGLNCVDGKSGTYSDKKYFYIFDYLQNFEFFRTNKNDGIESGEVRSLSEIIFSRKVKLIYHLQDIAFNTEEYQKWRDALVDDVYSAISGLKPERVDVRRERRYMEQFKDKNSFTTLSKENCTDLARHIAPLIIQVEQDVNAQQFDNFMYGLMLARLENAKSTNTYIKRLSRTAAGLTKMVTIPQINARMDFVKQVNDVEFIKQADIITLEKIRVELRDLIKFLTGKKREIVITDLTDKEIDRNDGIPMPIDDTLQSYREKVNRYILDNTDKMAIYKLRHNQQLTEEEFSVLEEILTNELGSKEDYKKEFKDTPLGVLVRKIARMDRQAVMQAFSTFINDQSLTQQQIVFVNRIIDNIEINGYMEPGALVEPPFDRPQTFIRMFDKDTQTALVNAINELNNNAVALAK